VRLTHPEAMGREWGVDIAVYPSETAGSVRAYALGILACGELIPGARARRWTSARIRKVRARAGPENCDAVVSVLVRFGEREGRARPDAALRQRARDVHRQVLAANRDLDHLVAREGLLLITPSFTSPLGLESNRKLKLTGLLGGMPTRHPCNWPPDAFYAFTPADLPQSMGAVMDPRRTIPASAS